MMVSILIPVYNTSKYLKECLDSVSNQTYKDLQIVIWNDGSTDTSLDICRHYAERYSNIELYSAKNKGVASTRNNLLSKVKGDYILFVDSDDWIEPEMVEFLVKVAQQNRADITICEKFNTLHLPLREENWDKKTAIREFLAHKRINGALWNKLIKTDLIKDNCFDPTVHYGEDAEFIWHLLQGISKITITNKPLYHYRSNPESLSRATWTPEKKGSGFKVWEQICKDVAKDFPEYLSLAYSRHSLEAMWALYFASLSGYDKDEHIIKRQKLIREHLTDLKKYPLDGKSKVVVAKMLSYWYEAGIVFRLINKVNGR